MHCMGCHKQIWHRWDFQVSMWRREISNHNHWTVLESSPEVLGCFSEKAPHQQGCAMVSARLGDTSHLKQINTEATTEIQWSNHLENNRCWMGVLFSGPQPTWLLYLGLPKGLGAPGETSDYWQPQKCNCHKHQSYSGSRMQPSYRQVY